MLPEHELWFEVIYLALQDFAGTTRESRVRAIANARRKTGSLALTRCR